MAFQLVRLLSPIDLANPTEGEVLALLGLRTYFIVEGEAGSSTAWFQVEVQGTHFYAQVEALADRDQYVLTDPTRGETLVRFATSCGDVCRYAAFCLVGQELIEQALRHFLQTGERAPDLRWEPTSKLLGSGYIAFD